ncbi:MAG: hypothetical protein V2A34_06480, partial [Lentisphaerota bacterium]
AQLEVASTLSGPNPALRNIKGPARWPSAFPRWLVVLLLIALITFAIGLLVRRFFSKPRTILNMPPQTPPYEVALAALRNLLSKGWIDTGKFEPFYTELSGIVRHYIEDRFGLKAPERTTEEFIREATNSRLLSPDHQEVTRDFLEQCDLVKFAKYEPQKENMQTAYASAERLVRETIPAPVAPQEAHP